MKKVFEFLKKYRKESIFGPLFKLLEASLELVVPPLVAAIIDRGIDGGDTIYVWKMCGLLVLCGFVGLGFSLTAQYFAAKASVRTVGALRGALYRHITTLSPADIDRIGTPTLITRMTADQNQVQSGLNLALRLLLRSPFVVFGAMIMAFTIDSTAAGVFAGAIGMLCIVVFGIMLLTMPLYKKVQGNLDRVLSSVKENLTGVRVIRAFCKEEDEIRDFDGKNDELNRVQRRVGRLYALMNPLTYVILNMAVLLLLRVGALKVDSGVLTQGQVIALYNYMSQILVELIKMADLIINITKSVASANRISAVFDMAPTMADNAAPRDVQDASVTFSHVSLRYPKAGADALEDIDFSVRPGETVGIIGGTGSGKSSLVNLIGRFYDATGGEVKVGGVPVGDYPLHTLRRTIGFVPQKAVLFRGTLRDNLLFGNENATDNDMYEALRVAQASDIVEKKGGLTFPITQGATNLSGGQKQRLTIARALIRKPKILILDDSASALDLATDAALRRSIAALPDAPTVFIVSQRTAAVMSADKILVLDEGRVVGMGSHKDLLRDCPVYREIYDSQFSGNKGGAAV